MRTFWILLLTLSVLSFGAAQRSLVSLSDVITLMSFIDPNWGENRHLKFQFIFMNSVSTM